MSAPRRVWLILTPGRRRGLVNVQFALRRPPASTSGRVVVYERARPKKVVVKGFRPA